MLFQFVCFYVDASGFFSNSIATACLFPCLTSLQVIRSISELLALESYNVNSEEKELLPQWTKLCIRTSYYGRKSHNSSQLVV